MILMRIEIQERLVFFLRASMLGERFDLLFILVSSGGQSSCET